MNKRASIVVTAFLEEKKAQTEQILSDADLRQIIVEALNSNYASFFQNKIRQEDIKNLIKKMYLYIKEFNESNFHEKTLDQELNTFKNKLLKIIEDIAKNQKNSIIDSIFLHFKKNPTSNSSDIEKFTQEFLSKAVSKADSQL